MTFGEWFAGEESSRLQGMAGDDYQLAQAAWNAALASAAAFCAQIADWSDADSYGAGHSAACRNCEEYIRELMV